MPIKESAKKALRQTKKNRALNQARQEKMRKTMKQFRKLVVSGQKEAAQKMIPAVYQTIDKAAKSGVIKKNNAARKKSRLMKMLK